MFCIEVSERIKDEPAVPVWVEQEISVEADKRLWKIARWGECTEGKVSRKIKKISKFIEL